MYIIITVSTCNRPLWSTTVLFAFPVLTDIYGMIPYTLGTLSGMGDKVLNEVILRDICQSGQWWYMSLIPVLSRQRQTDL